LNCGGRDAPQRIEASRPEGGPIQQGPDFSRLTLDELLLLEAMDKKAHGIANGDESLRREEEFRRLARHQAAGELD